MKVSELQVGDLTEVQVRPVGVPNFGIRLESGQEVQLHHIADLDELILSVNGQQWPIHGETPNFQKELYRVIESGLPYLCFIVNTQPKDSETISILLSIRQFISRYKLSAEEDIPIFLTDVHFQILQKSFIRRTKVTNAEALEWMREHALLKSGDRTLLLISAGRDMVSDPGIPAFRIFGKRVAIDVERREDGYWVKKLVQYHGPRGTQPVQLIEGRFEFYDQSVATQFQRTGMTELDNIVAQSESYLGLWNEYNQLEKKILIEKARQFGWLNYQDYTHLSDGWRLHIKSREHKKLEQIAALEEIDLEVAPSLPQELEEDYSPEEESGDEDLFTRDNHGLAVQCIAIDSERGWVDIRPLDQEDSTPPMKKGFIYASIGGDRVRLRRRAYAWKRIRDGHNPIPALGLLLERSEKFVAREYPAHKLERRELRRAFGGDPTPKQVRAIELALNTPDIALIQGPPGTGKTRVITALNKLLAGDRIGRGDAFGQILLTSYQHDAVENASSRSSVFGLPALKFGRRRYQDVFVDQAEVWAAQMVKALRMDPERPGLPRATTMARKVHAHLLGYLHSPGTPRETAHLLRDIYAETYHLLPVELASKLDDLGRRLRAESDLTQQWLDSDTAIITKAINSLATTPASFEDGGPENAYYLLRRIAEKEWVSPEDRQLLQTAADWDSPDAPHFLPQLADLKQRLQEHLRVPPVLSYSNLPNADVETLLTEISSWLMLSALSDRNQPDAVVEQFIIDLENDPTGVHNTTWHYTAVLAATCQQSVGRPMQFAKHLDEEKNASLEFETVIVDEAARSNPLDLLIPISLASRRIVLVGDHRQLPHILEPDVERSLERSSDLTRDALGKSLFERLFNYLRDREHVDGICRTVTLDQQYRMHPELGEFISRTFYESHDPSEGFRSDARPATDFAHNLDGYSGKIAAWLDVPVHLGRERGIQSKHRQAEARVIAEEVEKILGQNNLLSVGVIAFYAAQVQKILQALRNRGLADEYGGELQVDPRLLRDGVERLRVGTVDAFQGKEFDVVFLSVVRCNDIDPAIEDEILQRRKYGFLTLENRLCVAMSRQKRLLVAVGDSEMVKHPAAQHAVPGLFAFYSTLCKEPYGFVHRVQA